MNPLNIFKPAASRNPAWNLIKTLLQTSVFWLVFLILLPWLITSIEVLYQLPTFDGNQVAGISLLFISSALGLWSGTTMSILGKGTPLPIDCPNKLVVKGPYRYVRNPMAVAGISQGIAVGVLVGSYFVICYALSGAVLWHLIVRPREEEDLASRFGSTFLAYRQNVGLWIPRLIQSSN